jgi:hypothetical protein
MQDVYCFAFTEYEINFHEMQDMRFLSLTDFLPSLSYETNFDEM